MRRRTRRERSHAALPFFGASTSANCITVASTAARQRAAFADRNFKYLLVGPSIFVLLLIGIFPLVYLLVVSFQGITMTETDTGFVGLRNYAQLFQDQRLWEALLHTRDLHRHRAAGRAGARAGDGAVVRRPLARTAGLHRAAGVAGGGFADRLRRHLVADVRQPLRPDQPDHRLVRRRAKCRCCGPSIPTWSTRPSSSPRSGSGRRSCSCCCWPRSPTSTSRSSKPPSIDGAGYWRTFFRIVLPAIWPVMAIAILIRGLDLFRLFDIVWVSAATSPTSASIEAFDGLSKGTQNRHAGLQFWPIRTILILQ